MAVIGILFICLPTRAQDPPASKPPILMTGLGRHHHPISTNNPEAQRYFDQALTLVFAFNYEEALRSFQRAAELDPWSPMPSWGIALALGPNINIDSDPGRERIACKLIAEARALARAAPESERAYIEALSARYSTDPTLDRRDLAKGYAIAMGELSHRYPEDLDAATLYAESLMDLRPWKLWSPDGTPLGDTLNIITILESVLRRDPSHIGANHYYIHAIEASPQPDRALASARRLETAAPAVGHLLHMPPHIYIRTGDYSAAARSNLRALEADRAYLDRNAGWGHSYDGMYYCHNLVFLVAAYSMAGRFADADRTADKLVTHVRPLAAQMPELEFYLPTRLFVLLRFNRWKDVLKMSMPDPKMVMTTAFWHFGRGVAAAANGWRAQADSERKSFEEMRRLVPDSMQFDDYRNNAHQFLDLAADVMDAHIAAAEGNHDRATSYWRAAVEVQDTLNYSEPPSWYYPVRESLGAVLLLNGHAGAAEEVFREDLKRNPRNPRSLLGLWKSLLAQSRVREAREIRREFEAAWKDSDVQLRLEDF